MDVARAPCPAGSRGPVWRAVLLDRANIGTAHAQPVTVQQPTV